MASVLVLPKVPCLVQKIASTKPFFASQLLVGEFDSPTNANGKKSSREDAGFVVIEDFVLPPV